MRIALLLSLVVAAACTPSVAPARTADITGRITRVTDATGGVLILVEAVPTDTSGSPKASVLVDRSTRLFGGGVSDSQRNATGDDLLVGMEVSVWFAGPADMSYPVGAKAATIFVTAAPARPVGSGSPRRP